MLAPKFLAGISSLKALLFGEVGFEEPLAIAVGIKSVSFLSLWSASTLGAFSLPAILQRSVQFDSAAECHCIIAMAACWHTLVMYHGPANPPDTCKIRFLPIITCLPETPPSPTPSVFCHFGHVAMVKGTTECYFGPY